MLISLFYRSNPLLVCLAILGGLLVAKEVGFLSMRRLRKGRGDMDDGSIPLILTSVLTLLSLMLAFTYSVSQGSFERRRQLVIDEASAIGTVYLRAQAVPQPASAEVQDLCRRYVALRVEMASIKQDSPDKVGEFDLRSRQLQDMMWSRAASQAERAPTATVSILLQALNELIDLHNKRLAAYRYRVPFSIYLLLFGIATVAVGLTGCHFGGQRRRRDVLTVVFTVLVAATMWLILDLDHPARGTIKVSHQSFLDLQRELGSPPPDTLKRPD